MKRLSNIFFAAALALVSCSKSGMGDAELATLNFDVNVPGTTRAATIGDGSHVDEVVCAVFENGAEHKALRKVLKRNAGGTFPQYSPALYLGRDYQIVFWAHKSGKYNVEDMASITYSTNGYATNDETMDAFTLTQTVKINSDRTVTVGTGEHATNYVRDTEVPAVLKRPFAKLKIGTLASDWPADSQPTHSRITLSVVQTHYDAVAGKVIIDKKLENQEYHAPIVAETFTAVDPVTKEELAYKYVSLNYLFPGSLAEVTIEVAVKDFGAEDFNAETDVVAVVTRDNIPVNGNQQTALVGNLLKGELNFAVSVDGSFDATQDNNRPY